MCAIAGICNLQRKPVDRALLEVMAKSMAHRGPDDSGVWSDGHVGFSHRRLSIIDVSSAGHQPMANQNGSVCITYNGELYNFQELRSQLQALGHTFVSKTDTEVIIKSYEQWGAACLEKFNGMFAFAIWDKRRQQLLLARDRMGKKPLYYYMDGGKLVFASEIKGILQDKDIARYVNPQAMANYFQFGHSIAQDTMFKDIKKVLPGHMLVVKEGSVTTEQYWDSFVLAGPDKGEAYYKEGVANLFDDAVKKRLVADVPLGVFLSGGLDSSSVLAVMQKYSSGPISTFSVGFDIPGSEFNELADAAFVARHFNTRHQALTLNESDLLGSIEDIAYHFDEPFGDAANFPVFCMSRFASKEVKVVLTGEGGDEIFGGYRRYMVENNIRALSLLKPFISNPVAKALIQSHPKFKKLRQFAASLPISDNLKRQTNWLVCFSPAMQQQLFADGALAKTMDALAMYKTYDARYHAKNTLEKMMYLDQKILLPDGYLEKIDKATMSFGLEARAPLLDWRLVEFANAMPSRYKIKGIETKYIFKEAMKSVLPPAILQKKKHGFAVPTNIWLRGKLKQYLEGVLFDPTTRARGYFNQQYIESMYRAYQDHKKPFHYQLWLLLNFELWHRQFIDT